MRIFITGGSGLIGRRLVVDRLTRGDQIVLLSRNATTTSRIFAADANPNISVIEGNPAVPGEWQQTVDGCDAVVNLAGAGIADRRWTDAYKETLVRSRLDSTFQVVRAIEGSAQRPSVLLSTSAIGYYGDTTGHTVDESAPVGSDFLATLCQQWEEQALRAQSLQTRVAIVRVGNVLDGRGGMLAKLVRPFRFGVGGRWGSGRQRLSWIHWRDLINIMGMVLNNPDLSGPFNAVAPAPVTVSTFAKAVGTALRRPALVPAPAFGLRLLFGEFAEVMLMDSAVLPRRATEAGFSYAHDALPSALEAELGRSSAPPIEGELDGVGGVSSAETSPRHKPVRLIALGVDGTLLRSDGALPHSVVQACRSAERAGVVIVPATTRPPRAMRAVLEALNITGPVINYNGAVIWNPIDDEAQYHESLDGELVGAIIASARAAVPDVLVGLEILDRTFAERLDPAPDGHAVWANEPDYVGPLADYLHRPVTRLEFGGSPSQIDAVLKAIAGDYWKPGRIAAFRADAHLLHITHPHVDKSIALQRIAARLGADSSDVMAIGDAENDLGMLEWAGLAVAVDNAVPSVRELADAVVPSNDDQGVARAIQRFVLQPAATS